MAVRLGPGVKGSAPGLIEQEVRTVNSASTLSMLHAIERAKVIYDIHYCHAGVGFLFYAGALPVPTDWQKGRDLTVDRYYPTFEEAVAAEFGRLTEGKAST